MLNSVHKLFNKLFTADKWNIGVVNQSIDSLISNKKLDDINWLKEDNIDYAADPFVIANKEKVEIYYEELNFWKGNGEIMVMHDFDFSTKRKVSGVLPSSIHLSYPYLIQSNDDLYCVPETSASREVVLYKVDKSKTNQLTKQKVLLYGMSFVDSSIIFYNHKYWLFTSVADVPDKLYIYYSSHIDGDYQPHELNPIPVKKEACRSAGSLFLVKGFMYRPTQNPSNCYGGSIQINKICILTESHYQTESVFEILADKNYSKGIHNISFTADKIVVDGKRKVFEITMPLKKLVRKIRQ